jgi:hypothetical protein
MWNGIVDPAVAVVFQGRKSVAWGAAECRTPKRQSTEAARR